MKFKSGILIRYLFQLGQKTDMSELCGLLSQFSKGQKFNFWNGGLQLEPGGLCVFLLLTL